MYTTNQLFKVAITHTQWSNMGVEVTNVANHLDIHD